MSDQICTHPAGATIPSGDGWKCLDCGMEGLTFVDDGIECLRDEVEKNKKNVKDLVKIIVMKDHQIEQLTNWILRYGEHDYRCDALSVDEEGLPLECTCGLAKILDDFV